MDKQILNGLKHSLGFIIGLSIFFGIVYAAGFHSANEIIGGVFQGDYQFNGTVNFSNSNVSGVGLESVQVFTSNGTWTRPEGVSKIIVEVQGAGGGGASRTPNGGGGGGGSGGYCKRLIDVTNVSSVVVIVGTGGAGAVGGDNAGSGGTGSFFGSYCTGNPGGGADNSANPGAGGTALNGDININGQNGAFGNTVTANAGGGANSILGVGAPSSARASTFGGYGGTGYGAGGSGGTNSQVGGAGANGVVIVWEYR